MCTNRVGDDVGLCTNRVGDDVVCVQIGLVTMWFVYK